MQPSIEHRRLKAAFKAVCLLWSVGVGVAAPAAAQTSSGLPEVLRDMSQAGQMCRRDGTANRPMSAYSLNQAADMSCALPASEASRLLERPDAVLVDTRGEAAFEQFHRPGALRMGPESLRHKTYLRNKQILLMGDGKAERELYAACAMLKQQGFRDVRVLQGGMPTYVSQKGLPLVGASVPSALTLATLDMAQAWAESQFTHNVMVGVGSLRTGELLGAKAMTSNSPKALTAVVEQQRRVSRTPVASVVLVSDAALSEDRFQAYARAIAPLPLLVYSRGHEPLAKYLQTQKAVWDAHARGPKVPSCGL